MAERAFSVLPPATAQQQPSFHLFSTVDLLQLARSVDEHIRDGRFQRSLSAIAGVSSVIAGLEVSYEHYRGSYGNRVMYTPVLLSAALAAAGLAGTVRPATASRWLRSVSILTIADGVIGFGFHVRGISRKPGGWRLPVANLIMGPPIFAPLLFAVSAYLGLMASFLRPEEAPKHVPANQSGKGRRGSEREAWTGELERGRFQKHLAVITALGTFFSGFEALYSHYKNNFRYAAQWTPILISPVLIAAALASIKSRRAARYWLTAASVLALADGGIGFAYHVRGVVRRPGGLKKPIYNIIYGPPIFAPLLFAACGTIGLLAALMRRERK